MMKTIPDIPKFLYFLICVMTVSYSCEDLTVPDITGENVVLLAPSDNQKTSFSTQTFWWEYLDGATSYNLQVVSPSFDAIEVLISDTIINLNKFTINLFPGRFEWRLKAMNGSYQTQFIVRSLEIDSTMDLKGQKVTLVKPADDSYSNSSRTIFHWQKLYNADIYSIEVHNSNWNGNLVYSSRSVTSDTLSLLKLADGLYSWGVKGWNSNSATDFSTRSFTIDRTVPGVPSLSDPKDKAIFQQLPVNLTWIRAADNGSPLADSLLISTDSLFRSGRIKVAKLLNESALNDAVQDTGTYFWKVKTIDMAQNQGQFTQKRKFTVRNK